MLGEADAVDRRVAHVDVGRAHVDLGAQDHAAFGVLAGAHLAEQAQRFLDRPVAERGIGAGLGQRAARLARLVGGLLVDVRVAGLDQVLGKAIHVLEVVARVVEVAFLAVLPVEADPAHGVEDAVDELLVFLDRVGVVEAHVAAPAEVARQAEVQADALGVADVQVAVGLRRKAGADLGRVGRRLGVQVVDAGLAAPVARLVGAAREVRRDLVADEIGRRGRGRFRALARLSASLGCAVVGGFLVHARCNRSLQSECHPIVATAIASQHAPSQAMRANNRGKSGVRSAFRTRFGPG